MKKCQCALAAQKTYCILGCIKNIASRSREVILLYSTLMKLQNFIQLWGPQHKDTDLLVLAWVPGCVQH